VTVRWLSLARHHFEAWPSNRGLLLSGWQVRLLHGDSRRSDGSCYRREAENEKDRGGHNGDEPPLRSEELDQYIRPVHNVLLL
jgi:hypothetical protein